MKLKIEKLLFLVVAAVDAPAAVAAAVVGATVVAAAVPAVVRKILMTFHVRRSGFP